MINFTNICSSCLLKWESDQISLKCSKCNANNIISHQEINDLNIAHLDCDSFYASVEKRDNPNLQQKPVVVGGSEKGVVAAACYEARKYGIKSAMPIFKAKKLCPQLLIIKPRMEYYTKISREVRFIMERITPIIEPISIDEAFLDLSGTQKLHKCIPAISMLKIQKEIYKSIGITVSIGLSYNKSLAKLASEQNKPNGFFVLGKNEAEEWLSEKPVSIIFGLGKSTVKKLNSVNIFLCRDLKSSPIKDIKNILGSNTEKILNISKGIDNRPVIRKNKTKSISVETTFSYKKDDDKLKNELHLLCLKLSLRLKKKNLFGKTLTLKLKTTNFKLITRSVSINQLFHMAHHIYSKAEELLDKELKNSKNYRLIGVGISNFMEESSDNYELKFEDKTIQKKNKLENALDEINEKIGSNNVTVGRHFHSN